MGFLDSLSASPCKRAGYSNEIVSVDNKKSNMIYENPDTGFKIKGQSFDVYGDEAGNYCTESYGADITGSGKKNLTIVGDKNRVFPNGAGLTLGDARYNEIFTCQPKSEIDGWNSTNRLKCE